MTPFDIERSPALQGAAHGFFGSANGEHQFGFGGPGEASDVAALRAAAGDSLQPGARVITPHQVHSCDVITVTEAWEDAAEGRPVGDAVVSAVPGLALGIVTADCGPILFADVEAGVIGAAHAGWRGAQGGILENTVAAMEALGAQRSQIGAAIGPTIAQPSYEVDAPFRAHFTAADDRHFAAAPDRDGAARWHFDLPGYIAAQLSQSGVGEINDLARDTFAASARYHSYRRASRGGEPNYGRQIALIAL